MQLDLQAESEDCVRVDPHNQDLPASSQEFMRRVVTRYIHNDEFNEAALFFTDGSFLQFVHKGLNERWARPSTDETLAGEVCRSLRLFRLNAKHLQLYFEDGSDVEFFSDRVKPKTPGLS
jgi:hypothetical protein